MSNALKFIEDDINDRITHFEERLQSAIRNVTREESVTSLQSDGARINECSTALEVLHKLKSTLNHAKRLESYEIENQTKDMFK